jgi:hypothetical protein
VIPSSANLSAASLQSDVTSFFSAFKHKETRACAEGASVCVFVPDFDLNNKTTFFQSKTKLNQVEKIFC